MMNEKEEDEECLLPKPENGFGKHNIDDIFERAGGMGRYQILLQVLSFVIMVTVSHQALDMYFIAEDPPWSCELQRNTTTTQFFNHKNISSFCRHRGGELIFEDDVLFSKRCSLPSNEWKFDVPHPETYSIVTEYKLYCDKASMASLAHSAYFIGSSIGSIFLGYVADRYGRKHTFCALALIMFCSNMSTYFVKEMWQFILIRTIVGAAGSGCMNAMYVQVFEFMLPRHRAIASNWVQISYGTAIIYLACIAYFFRKWRQIILYTTIPCTISILALAMYQSPRWLLLKKRYQEAEEVLKKLSKFNKRPIDDICFRDNEIDVQKAPCSIIDCFKYKKTATIFFSILILQYFGGIVYYTMYLEFNRIGGSMYIVIIFAALADFPALVIASYFPNKIGRKKFFMVSFLIVALCTLPIVFIPKNYEHVVTVRIISSVSIKIFFSCGMDTLILWTLEVFPTAVRTQGLVLTSMGSKLGSATAPFIVEFFRQVSYVAPFLMIIGLSVCEILLSLLLPETLGLPSGENFEDFFVDKRNCARGNDQVQT